MLIKDMYNGAKTPRVKTGGGDSEHFPIIRDMYVAHLYMLSERQQ